MSKSISTALPFIYYREYFRVVGTAYVSEEGIFKERPENVTTPLIEIPVVYRICVATAGGELQIVDFANPPMLDKDKQAGGPVMVDGKEWYVEPGPSTTPLECTTVFSENLPENLKAVAEYMYKIAASREEILPES